MNSLCDKFEAAWQRGTVPSIKGALQTKSVEPLESSLRELIRIDLEMRWTGTAVEFADSDPLPAKPLVEDYLVEFHDVDFSESTILNLATAEFQFRLAAGDDVIIDEYLLRFPEHGPAMQNAMVTASTRDTPMLLRLFDGNRQVCATLVDRPISVGRQRHHEPPPYARVRRDSERLIVACQADRRISRELLQVSPVAPGRLRVTNNSAQNYCRALSGLTIAPQQAVLLRNQAEFCVRNLTFLFSVERNRPTAILVQ